MSSFGLLLEVTNADTRLIDVIKEAKQKCIELGFDRVIFTANSYRFLVGCDCDIEEINEVLNEHGIDGLCKRTTDIYGELTDEINGVTCYPDPENFRRLLGGI